MSAPTIDQLRGAVAYLELPRLERYARAHDCVNGLARNDDIAINVLCEHAKASLAAADLEAAKEDRVERGMLESLCECCDAEIPESSAYGHDAEGVYCCASCTAALTAAHKEDGAKLTPMSLEWCEHFGRRVWSETDVEDGEFFVCIDEDDPETGALLDSHPFAIPVEHRPALRTQAADPEDVPDAA